MFSRNHNKNLQTVLEKAYDQSHLDIKRKMLEIDEIQKELDNTVKETQSLTLLFLDKLEAHYKDKTDRRVKNIAVEHNRRNCECDDENKDQLALIYKARRKIKKIKVA